MNTVYALVDCNNFFASCERVFNPKLRGKPIVVLSNNDGCVISRSNEAKTLKIPMGAPAFKFSHIFEKHNVKVFSTNFTLYGDMSSRIMQILRNFTTQLEAYSIDEAFLDLHEIPTKSLEVYCRMISDTVYKWTGIPVSIGIGKTKTLAKAGSELAKKNPSYSGVCNMDIETNNKLAQLHVSDVWGIGRQYAKLLPRHNIHTALALKNAPDQWIRHNMTIQGLRTVYELRGTPCIELEQKPVARKSILTSRTFGNTVNTMKQLTESIAAFTAIACEKLRRQHSLGGKITVFIKTSPHRKQLQYSNTYTIQLHEPTNYTPDFIEAALHGLHIIYQDGLQYKRAGVLITGIIPDNSIQLGLFSKNKNHKKQNSIMKTIDKLNYDWGRNTITYAILGTQKPWRMRQMKRSMRFTTRWDELVEVG